MRVLLITDSTMGDVRGAAYRLFLGFYRRLGGMCYFYIYGPKEHEMNGESPVVFSPKHSYDDLVSEFNPDVIMVQSFHLCKTFAPPKTCDIPYICVEGDHHSIGRDGHKWYQEMKFDLVVHRGPIAVSDDDGIRRIWLPLSANEDEFFSLDGGRENKVAFIGNDDIWVREYDFRRKAIEKVHSSPYFKYIGLVDASIYPETLRKHVGILSCAGGDLHVTLGKLFEAMASGTVVVTPWFHGEKVLFGRECTVKFKNDLSDLRNVVEKVANDIDMTREVSLNALQAVNANHLHKHRIEELYDILYAVVYGGEIPDKWRLY